MPANLWWPTLAADATECWPPRARAGLKGKPNPAELANWKRLEGVIGQHPGRPTTPPVT